MKEVPTSSAGRRLPVEADTAVEKAANGSPWDLLGELTRQAALAPSGVDDVAQKQRARLRGIGMATVSSLLVVLVAAGLSMLKMVSPEAFFWFGLMTALWNITFYALVRTNLNLRFADPFLALPMMFCAIGVILFLMWSLTDGHALLSSFYILPFIFGILRLQRWEMFLMAGFVLIGDFLIMLSRQEAAVAADSFEYDMLRWFGLTLVLIWLAYMGSYIGNLRRRLAESHASLERAFETIKHMATHDELTGVLNRRHLVEMLRSEKARADRYGSSWSVCVIDIDFFKRVNDTLGHSGGDVVLRGFAQAAHRTTRPTDVFGRYGGEEFMLILGETRLTAAEQASERLRQFAEQLSFEGLDPSFRITVSVGVAEARRGESWLETVERADQALYRAKQLGRNRVEVAIEADPVAPTRHAAEREPGRAVTRP